MASEEKMKIEPLEINVEERKKISLEENAISGYVTIMAHLFYIMRSLDYACETHHRPSCLCSCLSVMKMCINERKLYICNQKPVKMAHIEADKSVRK